MIMKNIALIVSVVVFSFLLTGLIRRYAKSRNIVDVPNERSSHAIPTPREGGLSIAATFLVGIWFVEPVSRSILWSLVSSGIVVAGIGLWDDHSSIRARWRLLVHFLAALLAVFFLGGFVGSSLSSDSLNNALVVTGLVILSLVWLLNLFNFMDGIDGIAASEAIFISSSGALFCWLNGLEGLAIVSLIMAASTGGFLLLNWPPAKIFMGDVGSGFIGLMLGIIAYTSVLENVSIWIWVILFGIFFVDSGLTLIIRLIRGEKWHQAHCSHAYQNAARKWGHKSVTVGTILINLFWLFPLAYISYLYPNKSVITTTIAYIPLVILALALKAGVIASVKRSS